jgi:glycosyltransferase involved in cell wall biosynthesis
MTLKRLAAAEGSLSIDTLVLVNDGPDENGAIGIEHGAANGWDVEIVDGNGSLPAARELGADAVSTDWFLFLDDDVRLRPNYLDRLADAIAPAVGAIQGRKASRTEAAADWHRRRARRGGTHATLIRTAAVEDLSIPSGVDVLEDEYIRRYVESQGYLWSFHADARFEHDCQDRHPIGWREGVVGGRHGLSQGHTVALNVPHAAATGRNPWPHCKRLAGWVWGRATRQSSSASSTVPSRPPSRDSATE